MMSGLTARRRILLGFAGLLLGGGGLLGSAWLDHLGARGASLTLARRLYARRQDSPSATAVGLAAERAGQSALAWEWYRRALLVKDLDPRACRRLLAVSLEVRPPRMVLFDHELALAAGCEEDGELRAPVAVALARLGAWDEAEDMALRAGRDAAGLGLLVRVAAGLRRGQDGPLRVLGALPGAPSEAQARALIAAAGG